MKLYTITIPTTGYEVWEVKAKDEAEARTLLETHNRTGEAPQGRLKMEEEGHGEWEGFDEWEIEEEEATE